jgi:GNAT superfamily N-acetyltransferase
MPLPSAALHIRPVTQADQSRWLPLWQGYNAFYGRSGQTALPDGITQATWQRFLNPLEPVFALVAESEGELVGLAHYLFHRSTTRLEPVCYLQDVYADARRRKQGIGKALIQAVYAQAAQAGASRVYWQTQASNEAGRALYDRVAEHRGFIVYAHEMPAAPDRTPC